MWTLSVLLCQCFKDLGQSQRARQMCEAAFSMNAVSKEVNTPVPTLPQSMNMIPGGCQPAERGVKPCFSFQDEEAQKELAALCPALGL